MTRRAVGAPPVWVTAKTPMATTTATAARTPTYQRRLRVRVPDQEDTLTTSEALEVWAGLAASLTVTRTL